MKSHNGKIAAWMWGLIGVLGCLALAGICSVAYVVGQTTAGMPITNIIAPLMPFATMTLTATARPTATLLPTATITPAPQSCSVQITAVGVLGNSYPPAYLNITGQDAMRLCKAAVSSKDPSNSTIIRLTDNPLRSPVVCSRYFSKSGLTLDVVSNSPVIGSIVCTDLIDRLDP